MVIWRLHKPQVSDLFYLQFYSLKWFLGALEVYRLVPGARRHLRRMAFHTNSVTIDLQTSKLIDTNLHQLVLQRVHMDQSGEYKCQVGWSAGLLVCWSAGLLV